jgi:hypothetical protein
MKRIATGVDWAFAPEWLTIEQASALSGWTPMQMLDIIEQDGVELADSDEILISKQSLLDYQETCAQILHFDE